MDTNVENKFLDSNHQMGVRKGSNEMKSEYGSKGVVASLSTKQISGVKLGNYTFVNWTIKNKYFKYLKKQYNLKNDEYIDLTYLRNNRLNDNDFKENNDLKIKSGIPETSWNDYATDLQTTDGSFVLCQNEIIQISGIFKAIDEKELESLFITCNSGRHIGNMQKIFEISKQAVKIFNLYDSDITYFED